MYSQIVNNTPLNFLSPNESKQARGDLTSRPSKKEFPSAGGDRGGSEISNNHVQGCLNPTTKKVTTEEGFSLVEILVAITLTTIIIGFAFGIYLFGQRFFLQWQNRLFLQNKLHTYAHGITEELFRADRITSLEPQKLVLQKYDSEEKKYEVRNDTLLINDNTLLNPSLSLVTFKLSALDKKQKPIEESDLKTVNNINTTFVQLTLALTNGRDTLKTTRSVHLRKPSNWNLLNIE